jgi:hypothetical protein
MDKREGRRGEEEGAEPKRACAGLSSRQVQAAAEATTTASCPLHAGFTAGMHRKSRHRGAVA